MSQVPWAVVCLVLAFPRWCAGNELARAAEKAPEEVAALYRALAKPTDLRTDNGKTEAVEPQPAFSPDITPHEQTALARVEAFLKSSDSGLSQLQRAEAAEVALAAVLRFHLSQRERPPGGTNLWAGVEGRLRAALRDARNRRLHAAADAARTETDWAGVVALADRVAQTYPGNTEALREAARARTGYGAARYLAGDSAAAFTQVEWVERHFLRPPRFEPVRAALMFRPGIEGLSAALRARARELAEAARKTKDDRGAAALLEKALATWPRLPKLRDEYLKRQHSYAILYVAVKTLPEFLSPVTARTDAERQAVELLFEGLLKPTYDAARGQRYLPQLASAEIVLGGRRFLLDSGARWSDGERVTAADVRDTMLLLKSSTLPGRTPEWADLVEDPLLGDDLFRVEFRLRQGFFEPRAPLAFKVLPQLFRGQPLKAADDKEFAKAPVGSGPYVYRGREQHDGRACAVFAANPLYRHADQPLIREIRFYVPADPVGDFLDKGRTTLVPDLPTGRLRDLEKAGFKDTQTYSSRRVFTLAVNHRVPALAEASVRRAFAHAIDRERLLNFYFRGGEPAHQLLGIVGSAAAVAARDLRDGARKEFHRPVNGPYPPQSWAQCPPPRVPAALFDPDRARAFAREALAKVPKLALTLKYPEGDPRVAEACRDLAGQLERLGMSVGWKVSVTPVALPPRQLAEALEKRDYELAYHALDYADETYWLWPLFDSRPEALRPGGANVLGYENDGTLEGLFRTAMGQRDFAEVRKLTHAIGVRLYEQMPLVPLWQLDVHAARPAALRAPRYDPLLLFDGVEDWQLETK